MSRRIWLAVPLLMFALFVGAALWRLGDPPRTTIESKLVGQPLPPFATAAIVPGKSPVSSAVLAAERQPRLVNLFASWCVPCIAEAPVLAELKRQGVRIDGIAVRDSAADLTKFLSQHGDGYERIGSDPAGQAQIALGASGVPETFLVDGGGVIRYHHVGPIMPQDIGDVLAAWRGLR
ncbi:MULTISPECIES: DsbE family thiol:disulfide interchange protein [Sphingomonas]|uniref:DsbE family thiol:disulfide interchange protein n=1 Tax=Sphingomonas TaxID=13687 RepID=UPI001F077E19|nr:MULTISPECIES: DsbE family thiol:disulfide interchange protein [Sphingomonas]